MCSPEERSIIEAEARAAGAIEVEQLTDSYNALSLAFERLLADKDRLIFDLAEARAVLAATPAQGQPSPEPLDVERLQFVQRVHNVSGRGFSWEATSTDNPAVRVIRPTLDGAVTALNALLAEYDRLARLESGTAAGDKG